MVGSNAAEAHPIIFQHILRGVHQGAKLVVVDPRATLTAKRAHEHYALEIGSDIALFNSLAHVIIRDKLQNQSFIERATTGFAALQAEVTQWPPERAAAITGIDASRIEHLAHAYASAKRAMICWTLGITEHHNAVDNVFALINLALLRGNVGRPGAGLNPLRGQNNVQGGGDMGALPNRLPGFQDLTDAAVRNRFEQAWGVPLSPKPGWNQTQMFEAMADGRLKGLYVIGENPLESEANSHHIERIFDKLDALVVQDLFLTPTAERADVVFPAAASFAESEGTYTNSERRVQLVRSALTPPGEARDDVWIVQALARAMGHPWIDKSAEEVFAEVRELAPNFRGISYARLAMAQGLQWPVPHEDHLGTAVLHTRLWQDPVDPRVPFMPVDFSPPVERPTVDYPLLLTTGRRLAFYNTGVQSNVYAHPHNQGEQVEVALADAERLELTEGMWVRVTSRRGWITGPVHISASLPPGVVFLSFHFPDQVRTNVLSIDATDPRAGTAEFKAAAVRVEKWSPSQEA